MLNNTTDSNLNKKYGSFINESKNIPNVNDNFYVNKRHSCYARFITCGLYDKFLYIFVNLFVILGLLTLITFPPFLILFKYISGEDDNYNVLPLVYLPLLVFNTIYSTILSAEMLEREEKYAEANYNRSFGNFRTTIKKMDNSQEKTQEDNNSYQDCENKDTQSEPNKMDTLFSYSPIMEITNEHYSSYARFITCGNTNLKTYRIVNFAISFIFFSLITFFPYMYISIYINQVDIEWDFIIYIICMIIFVSYIFSKGLVESQKKHIEKYDNTIRDLKQTKMNENDVSV